MNIILKKGETMQDLVNRLYESANLVYDIAPVAYWYEDLNENGRLLDIHFSDHMREKLGYKSTEEFPDDLNAFVSFLHPDDVQLMLDNAIAAGTGKSDKFDCQYRIRKVDGSYMWCNATGELVKDFEGKTVGMYGAFIDITEEVELREKQEAARNTQKLIQGFTEEFDAAFYGRISDGTYQVLTNVDIVSLKTDCITSIEEAMRNYVKYFVHPEDAYLFDGEFTDMELVKKNIPVGESKTFEYRSKSGGEYYWFRALLRRVSEDEILIGFKNCDKEVIDNIIATQLIKDYDAIYTVDLDADRIRSARSSKVSEVGNFNDRRDYSPLIKKFAETVAPQYKQDWLNFGDPEYMKQYMADEDHREYIYELPGLERKSIRRLNIDVLKRINGEASVILLSFAGIDEKRAMQIEYENRAKRAMSVISAMAEDFDYINSLNTETGEITRYYASDKFYQVEANIPRDIPDRDRLDIFLKTVVHPNEWERFIRLTSEENLRHELSRNPVYKFECLTLSPEGREEYYRFKFTYMQDEPNMRVMGLLNIDEQVRREHELAVANEKAARENIEQNLKIIEILASEYTSVYYIDLNTDGLTPYAMNEETETTFGSVFRSGITYSEAYKLYVDKLIYGDDKAMMLKAGSIANIKKELKNKKTFLTQYRSADNKYSEMKFVKVGKDEDKPEAVALGFAEKDEEIRREQQNEAERQMNFDIIEILASEYTSVYYIDLTTDGLNPYTMNADTESAFGKIFRSGINYSDAFRMYVGELVLPEDKAMMLKAGSIGNIMKELKNKKTFLTTYRNSEGHYSEMKFVKVGDEEGFPVAVALGFADKDEELRAKEEESRILQRNIDIIEILASEYTSVYYIDLTTDELDPYTMNAETESEFGQIFRSGIKYSDAFRMYVDSLVFSEDKEMMLKAGSIYNILRELENKKTFLTTYRSDNNGNPRYCEMKFVKVGDEENPTAVALGFADKDDEIRNEMLRREKAERDMAVITGLSDDFGCVVYTGFEDSTEIHYRFDPIFEQHIPGWSKIERFSKRLDALVNSLVHPDDRDSFYNATRPEIVRSALQNTSAYYVNFRLLIDGEITYYQLKFARDPKYADTKVIAGFHNVDVETRREMEALEKAETANRAKTDFLFNMSHDIRTPMNAVTGYIAMARKNLSNSQKVADCLEKAEISSGKLLSLINQVLEMSRVESGKITLAEEPADVIKRAETMELIAIADVNNKGLKFTCHVGDIKHKDVLTDISRMDQIVTNIVGNAVKYTPEGGTIDYYLDELPCDMAGYGLYKVTVKDSGIGMSEEFIEHIFDEFSREKSSTVSHIQGTGLGMSIVKKLIDLMGGSIDIKSEQGKGTEISVYIPMKWNPDPKGIAGENISLKDVSLKGMRVLLVEDNEMNREIATEILEDEGVIVDTAEDGDIAVEMVRKSVERMNGEDSDYDAVLMDIQMPRMDGYEATRAIRETPPLDRHLPIIALSANAFEEDKKKSLAAGMDDHVAKPINIQELKETLAKYL